MAFFQLNDCDTLQSSALVVNQQHLKDKVIKLKTAIEQKSDQVQLVSLSNELKYEAVRCFAKKEKELLGNRDKSYHQYRQTHDRFIWKISDLQSELTSNHYDKIISLCIDLLKWFNPPQ